MSVKKTAELCLMKELKNLSKEPVDGFSVGLVNDDNIFEWSITIMGPLDTPFEGGIFKAKMNFPADYPNNPPKIIFTSDIYHPNIYPDGKVCMSTLHSPGDDLNGYELSSERWRPVHTISSIILSLISLLASPNPDSPANVDAAKLFREDYAEFRKQVYKCVMKSQEEF